MKFIASFALLLVFTHASIGQQVYKSEKLKIQFSAPAGLESYNDSEWHTGYDSYELAVEIERFPWSEDRSNYDQGAQISAKSQTQALGFKNYNDGTSLKQLGQAHYYIAIEEDEGQQIPVFVVSILLPEKKVVYEIQVYCYEIDEEIGKRIVESIRLLE